MKTYYCQQQYKLKKKTKKKTILVLVTYDKHNGLDLIDLRKVMQKVRNLEAVKAGVEHNSLCVVGSLTLWKGAVLMTVMAAVAAFVVDAVVIVVVVVVVAAAEEEEVAAAVEEEAALEVEESVETPAFVASVKRRSCRCASDVLTEGAVERLGALRGQQED